MINLIPREVVFYKSSVADHYISEEQHEPYNDDTFELFDGSEATAIRKKVMYDHMEPFHNEKVPLDDFAVIGHVDRSRSEYLARRSAAFIQFFELMQVDQLYLLDVLKANWLDFPYRRFDKKETMKNIVKQTHYDDAFEIDREDLSTILPLFHYSGRHSVPIIYLFPANSSIHFATFVCDDDNLHISFQKHDRRKFAAAANEAGMLMGGVEVCAMR